MIFEMNKEEILLKELILALNHIGLDWQMIMEDYVEYQKEINMKSINNISKLESIIKKFKKVFQSSHFHRYFG
jgi:hypothetical protein